MKSPEEIEKRRDMFDALSRETESQINDLEIRIKKSQSNFEAASLTKQKEILNMLLTVTNSQWVELTWVLNK